VARARLGLGIRGGRLWAGPNPSREETRKSLRKTGKTLVLVGMAAGATNDLPAWIATARNEPASGQRSNFTPRRGQSVVDWNRELITIIGTRGLARTVHPTSSFAAPQAAPSTTR